MPRHNEIGAYLSGDPEWSNIISAEPEVRLNLYVKRMNNYRWVVESGKLFYIASRQRADGTIERFVDRHI